MGNLLNIHDWTVGTGNVGSWSSGPISTRYYGPDPWNKQTIIWECTSNGSALADMDGAFTSALVNIDNTALYRFSVWVNRKVVGTKGNLFFGPAVTLINIYNGATDSNPYFYYTSDPPVAAELPENTWVLLTAHVFPHTHSGTTPYSDTGRYKLDGTKLSPSNGTTNEYKWVNNSTQASLRCYLYYCATNTTAIQLQIYPRIDKCDGTQPTIQQLLRNKKQALGLKTSFGSFSIKTTDVVSN